MSLFGKAAIAAMLTLSAPAAATWREASSTHFLIYSEDNPARLREFATELERFDSAIRYLRNVPPADPGKANRVTVYVVSNINQVQKLAGDKSRSVAGYYRSGAGTSFSIVPRHSGNGSRFDLDAETVLLHEYTHHFMFATYAGSWPRWFVEGYAEFHATADFGKDGSVGMGKAPLFRAYGLLNMPAIPVEQLLDPPEKMTSEQVDAFYGRSWLLMHYLTFEPSRKGQLSAYLAAIGQGKSNIEAARAAFGDLAGLNANVAAYLKRPRLNYVNMAARAINPGPVEIRDLGLAEQSLMPLRIRSRNGVDKKEAEEVLQLARTGAAAFPNDPFAQTVLAEAEYDTDHFDEALAAAERAIAADPKSMDGLLYKARVLKERARSQQHDPAAWKAVRSAFIAANRVDPDDPRPLIGFYNSFLDEGIAPTKNAVTGLASAQILAPQDGEVRMLLAHQYLNDDKPTEARALLEPIAYDPHPSDASRSALAIIEQIDTTLKKPAAAPATGDAQHR